MQVAFQNQNRYINYPFKENVSLLDVVGGLELRPKVIIDFVAYGVEAGRKYYLSRSEWNVASKQVWLSFQDDLGNGYARVAVPTSTAIQEPTYSAYTFISTDETVKGRVVVDRYAATKIWRGMTSDTINNFALDGTEFEPGTVIPAESAVTSLNKLGSTWLFKDNVRLKEGHNINLTRDETGIVITAAQNAGKGPVCYDRRICYSLVDPAGNGTNTKLCGLDKALMTFGGAVADDNCQIFIIGNNCMRVLKYPALHMIALHNECSEVCDEQLVLNEIQCRLCRIQVEQGLISGPCDAECADAPPEEQWHQAPSQSSGSWL